MADDLKYFVEITQDEHDRPTKTKRSMMYGWDSENLTPVRIAVDEDGTFVSGMAIPQYDYFSLVLSVGDTVETYVFKTGGASGDVVATVTLTYTDSTRSVLSTGVRT